MNAIERALIRRLDLVAPLSNEDKDALRQLPITRRTVRAGSDLVVQGRPIDHSGLLIEGFAHRYRDTREGKRQILAFHVAGDIPDLHSLRFNTLDHNVAATVDCEFGFIPHEAIWNLMLARPNIASAFWREVLIDGSIFRRWIVALGRMPGLQRTAHLLCEMTMRMTAMQRTEGGRYHLPLTQIELADALGLTVVTVNRTLQSLRQEGLIERNRFELTIKNWPRLAEIGQFDPGYLHFRRPPEMDGTADDDDEGEVFRRSVQ